MPRYKCVVEYDGTPFVGWQRQANGMAVQQVIEDALERIFGRRIVIHAAGRTDTGVHARGQVIHFDTDKAWECWKLREAINAHMRPRPVAVLEAGEVDETFEARFSARKRHYLYIINNRRAPLTLERHHAWHVPRRLDAAAMHDAAQALVGKHDFTTFRAAECQANSPVRTMDRLDVTRDGDRIEIRATALSFLHHQIRSITGSLEHVGSGKWRVEDMAAALEARDRARCGRVAPPHGLYLMQVDY